MILAGGAALLVLLAFGGVQESRGQSGGVRVRHQQIIVRVTAGERRSLPPGASMIRWRESRGPRCITASQVLGATLLSQSSVDLIMRDNRRVRARLHQRCPALDYYRGFYIDTTADGRICADRDAIRSRVGGECEIEQFRALTAERP
jgi:hypothetical protein